MPLNPHHISLSTKTWSPIKAGFKPLFTGNDHLFLTHLRHPSATQLIETMSTNREH